MGFGSGFGMGRGYGYGRGFGGGRGGVSGFSCIKFLFFGFNVLFWVRIFIDMKIKSQNVFSIYM